MASLVMVLQLSINFVVPIILCTLLSYFISLKIGKKGVVIVGIIVGIIAAFNAAYRQLKRYTKDEESPGQRARRLEEEGQDDKLDKKTQ